MRMLELGCGDNPRVTKDCIHYVGVDASHHALEIARTKLENHAAAFDEGAFSFSLEHKEAGISPLNFPESTFDFVLGDQFLEHVPRVVHTAYGTINPVIRLLNEVCRFTKPGGLVQFNVPKWNSQEMWQDPTHCNPVPPNFWIYWDPKDEWGIKKSYGIEGSLHLYETVDAGWYHIFKLRNIKFK